MTDLLRKIEAARVCAAEDAVVASRPPELLANLSQPGRVMRQTEGLRFLERTEDLGDGTARRVRVPQQAWVPVYGGQIEWRDVPLVTE